MREACTIITKIADGLSEFSSDIDALGDAYEYLIGQFAAGSGKKAGEFYTPQQVSDILSGIVTLDSQEPATGKKDRLASVLDFACGSPPDTARRCPIPDLDQCDGVRGEAPEYAIAQTDPAKPAGPRWRGGSGHPYQESCLSEGPWRPSSDRSPRETPVLGDSRAAMCRSRSSGACICSDGPETTTPNTVDR
jgi:hypothetical protein